jgi:hypothetical protein
MHPKVAGTTDGGRVLDASAHLLSRGCVSQSASVTFCILARVLALLVLRVSIVFVVYCVNIVFTWRILLVFSTRYIIDVLLKHENWTLQGRKLACEVFTVTSVLKQTSFVCVFVCLYIYIYIYIYIYTYINTYLLCGATVLVELWPPHILCARFHDNEFLQGGVVSPTPNPQPGGPGYLS